MKSFEKHPHWGFVKEVGERLQRAGFQAVLAGGCVRDALLGRDPNDFDIATNATPDQVEQLFDKTVAVGKAFGVIALPFEHGQVEVATFRSDGDYPDGRHPHQICFASAREDAQRRDFTVNAMFYSLDSQRVIDYVGGRKDLNAGILRTVGDAQKRFEEDKLRVLRAVRFAAQLDFVLSRSTARAVGELAPHIHQVAKERLRDELDKLLASPARVYGLHLLQQLGVLGEVLPAVAEGWAVGASATRSKCWVQGSRHHSLSWAAVLSPLLTISVDRVTTLKELQAEVTTALRPLLEELRFSKHRRREVIQLVGQLWVVQKALPVWRTSQLRRALSGPLSGPVKALFTDLARKEPKRGPKKEPKNLEAWLQSSGLELFEGELPAPLLQASDLMSCHVQPGAKMGELLERAYDYQLELKDASRQALLDWLRAQT